MRILITGANGQLGIALQRALGDHDLTLIDLPEVDITDREALAAVFAAAGPELVVHCAAYTDVDGCARNPELAYRVNATGTQNVALACQSAGAALVHISTNEVFAGDEPGGYEEWMPLAPRNPYGRSKAAAEAHVRALLGRAYIVRTAWLYAPGGRNFIHAILRRARETGTVRVVTDEVGNPTYAPDLAAAIAQLIATRQYGTYHFVNSGACSRWAFANEILRQAGVAATNVPILSSAYPRASTPPPFAALHNRAGAALGITLRPWPEALADYLRDST
ncbi:MAG: dTDP-4-dehydrorhamnose reductase [Candidatus Promineofilum sp.]|nr:dTDP-4-dehydrorhamnose reductase [Promineifilum sp.]MCW5864075.1 dTDP-4-dehydrorhamnose reductase [Anaerolineae bacterium]